MGNNLLMPMSATPWKWDSVNSRWYLQVGALKVIQVDSNGNVFAPGRFLKS